MESINDYINNANNNSTLQYLLSEKDFKRLAPRSPKPVNLPPKEAAIANRQDSVSLIDTTGQVNQVPLTLSEFAMLVVLLRHEEELRKGWLKTI